MNSIDTRINLTDAQIEEAFDKAGRSVVVGDDEIVITHESLEDFRASIGGSIREATDYLPFRHLARDAHQRFKGDQRRDVRVIDFGDVRAVARG